MSRDLSSQGMSLGFTEDIGQVENGFVLWTILSASNVELSITSFCELSLSYAEGERSCVNPDSRGPA
jgi:hypothetical protein